MKNKTNILLIALMLISSMGWAQVGIGTTSPDASAALHLSSTSKTLLIPRMTTANRDANILSPSEGILIYNITDNELQISTASGLWLSLNSGVSTPVVVGATVSTGKVGIGTASPDANTILDVSATNKGVLLPLLAADPSSGNVAGMLYYNTTTDTVHVYTGSSWVALEVFSSVDVLAQIGNEGDNPDVVNSVITAVQLALVVPSVTGIVLGNETAYQDYIDTNPDDFDSPATQAQVQAMVDAVNAAAPVYCTGSTTTIVDVVGSGGATWMDRNLGATQQATSSTDAAAYGDLYQWGRFTDGHQCRTSGTTSTNATTATPGHGDFITTGGSFPFDWLTPEDDTLWQGVGGTNNPCPSGYRLPTETELNTELSAWGSINAAGAFASPLKLPVAGLRYSSNGALANVGSSGVYWASAVSGTTARNLFFSSSAASVAGAGRANGGSVRCIKN